MAKNRQLNDGIWDQDWFLDLPNDYKVFYLYLVSRGCDHAGIWTVSRRMQQQVTNNKLIHFEDFINAVNKDEIGGESMQRIVVLDKYKWFIPQFVFDNYQGKYQPKLRPHVSMLKILTFYKIDLTLVKKFDWSGLKTQSIDFQDNANIGNTSPNNQQDIAEQSANNRQPLPIHPRSIATDTEKDIDTDTEKRLLGEKQNLPEPQRPQLNGNHSIHAAEKAFALQSIYNKSWHEIRPAFPKLTEEAFLEWKRFVDFVKGNKFSDLFEAKFITPQDWPQMVEKGFTEDRWEIVCQRMCGSGVNPTQNLFHRIPQFLNGVETKPNHTTKKSKTNVDTGSIDYTKME